jgi:FdrA protein
VLERLEAKLESIAKPTVVCCVGAEPRNRGKTVWVDTLDQAGEAVVALLSGNTWKPRVLSDAARVASALAQVDPRAAFERKQILGLYTGGTLAYETTHLLDAAFGGDHPHRIIDLGDDQYTVGRPHPMIDPRVRLDMIERAANDATVGVVLLDLVLGKGAHANPAEPLATAVGGARRIAHAQGRELVFLASVIGTARDPQGLAAQTGLLEEAGIAVLATNADAARCAAMLTSPQLRSKWMPKEA